jgi:hypothetical protein
MYAKWTMAPSGNYIGVIEFNNRHYYAYGRNADHLEKNLKSRLYQEERVPTASVHLEHEMSEAIDLQYASKMFISKFVKQKMNRQPIMVNKVVMAPKEIVDKENKTEQPNPNEEYIHQIDEETNELVIYKLTEVARYKLRKENKGE